MNRIVAIKNLLNSFDKMTDLYQELNKTVVSYNTDTLLTPPEIHAISIIHQHPKLNLTSLTNYLNVTKGTTTKTVQRLIKKQMVTKQFAPNSEKQIEINLTKTGEIAAEYHDKHVEKIEKELFSIYDGASDNTLVELSEINQRTIKFFIKEIQKRNYEK